MIFSKSASLFLYLCIYTISSVSLHFTAKSTNKLCRRLLYIFSALIVVLFASLRYKVGTDYGTYSDIYKTISEESLVEYLRNFDFTSNPIGLYVFAKIGNFFNSIELFFCLFALTIYLPISYVIVKQKNVAPVYLMSFAFLTTLYTTGFNLMKQVAAISIAVYAIQNIFENRGLKFIAFALLACCFHPTAVIIFPIYLLRDGKVSKFEISRIKTFLIVVGSVLLLMVYPQILKLIGGKFEDYLTNEIKGNNFTFIITLLWFFIIWFFKDYIVEHDNKNKLYIVLLFIGLIYELLGFKSPYIKRIALYFTVFSLFLIPQVSGIFTTSYKPLFNVAIYVYYIILFFVDFYLLGHANIIPYMVK